jgi:signal transduction histidine kinase
MKLLNRTNLYFVLASLVVFCLGGVLFYFLFQLIIDKDFNYRLRERKNYYIETLAHSDSLLYFQKYSANSVEVARTGKFADSTETTSDTVLYDHIEKRLILYRQIAVNKYLNHQYYKIYVRRALVERKDIIEGVILLEVFLFLAFIMVLSLLNNQLSKKIWKPFYVILETINTYKVERPESLHFERDVITEFNELAAAIEKMTSKINQEFYTLKSFSENASHETQTPLAIIKNKLEVLMQSPGLLEEQMGMIDTALTAANRLSKLNEALLILSRIENRQFHNLEAININERINYHLATFDELIRMKGIRVKKEFHDILEVKMNSFLADILLENLVVNAIKHNAQAGSIIITIRRDGFEFANTGETLQEDPSRFFERFVKSNPKSTSLGLGLSIVKAISDTYHLTVRYTFSRNYHYIGVHI